MCRSSSDRRTWRVRQTDRGAASNHLLAAKAASQTSTYKHTTPFGSEFETNSCSHALSPIAKMALALAQPPAASCSHAAGARALCSSPVLAEPSLQEAKKRHGQMTAQESRASVGVQLGRGSRHLIGAAAGPLLQDTTTTAHYGISTIAILWVTAVRAPQSLERRLPKQN